MREQNLIRENELYNGFHTQTHNLNLHQGQWRTLALGLVVCLMPSNSFRLSMPITPTCFFSSFPFTISLSVFLCSCSYHLTHSLTPLSFPPYLCLALQQNKLQIETISLFWGEAFLLPLSADPV